MKSNACRSDDNFVDPIQRRRAPNCLYKAYLQVPRLAAQGPFGLRDLTRQVYGWPVIHPQQRQRLLGIVMEYVRAGLLEVQYRRGRERYLFIRQETPDPTPGQEELRESLKWRERAAATREARHAKPKRPIL